MTLLNHHILKFLDSESRAVRVLSVDFSKAFDRLPHKTNSVPAINSGLPRQAISWIDSFLCDRRQRVKIDSSLSSWSHCGSGVPQGSVIGPLLFCLATDSLTSVCNNSKVVKYADDITLLHFLRKDDDDQLQREVDNICTWSRSSGLPLNPSKCHVMNVITKSSLTVNDVFDSDGVVIPSTTSMKILGVTLTENLRWDAHLEDITKKSPQTTLHHPKSQKSRYGLHLLTPCILCSYPTRPDLRIPVFLQRPALPPKKPDKNREACSPYDLRVRWRPHRHYCLCQQVMQFPF